MFLGLLMCVCSLLCSYARFCLARFRPNLKIFDLSMVVFVFTSEEFYRSKVKFFFSKCVLGLNGAMKFLSIFFMISRRNGIFSIAEYFLLFFNIEEFLREYLRILHVLFSLSLFFNSWELKKIKQKNSIKAAFQRQMV